MVNPAYKSKIPLKQTEIQLEHCSFLTISSVLFSQFPIFYSLDKCRDFSVFCTIISSVLTTTFATFKALGNYLLVE